MKETKELAEFPLIDAAELARRLDGQNIVALDLRATSHGEQIYGAVRYETKKLAEAERLVLPLPKGSGSIVLYDEDGPHDKVREIAAKLAEDGYGEILLLDGGFAAWKAADGKMQERSMEQPVPEVSEHQIVR